MKKKMLYVVIGLICLSALGITAIQLFWIRNAFQVKEAQFTRSVNEALGRAVNKLETQENITFLSRNYKQDSIRLLLQSFVNDTLSDWQKKLESLTTDIALPPPPPHPPENFMNGAVNRQNGMRHEKEKDRSKKEHEPRQSPGTGLPENPSSEDLVNFFDELNNATFANADTFIYEVPSEFGSFEYRIIVDDKMMNQPYIFSYQDHGTLLRDKDKTFHVSGFPAVPPGSGIREQLKKLNVKTRKVQDIIRRIAIELEAQPKPILNRIDEKNMVTTLRESFTDKDILIPFEFAVLSPENDSLPIPIKTKGFKTGYLGTEHRVSLFPNDIFRKPDLLLVYFPGEKTQVLKSISWLLAGSSFFILFILLTSGLSIYFMIRQKKISDIKTDFINNMTHEFKTPIATISIAADSISNPKVISDPETIRNYTRIIKEENSRMNSRVEQVLQMALLDSKDFSLDKKVVDIHGLIQKIAANIRLQVEQREGSLVTIFSASRTEVNADESHLANVFLALFDNAIKYSGGKPDITVETRNADDSVRIFFRDKGIGMTPDVRQRIFDKFYRVTRGNIHDIKGFGLGLSYAKAIILAHGGEIRVESEPGKGSTFELTLPVL